MKGVKIVAETRIKHVLERRVINSRIGNQFSVIIANKLDI